MQKARVSAIAAIGRNRELGCAGSLLWRIPDDLRRVKTLTVGHPLIMGRKTYESIGKPLPGRTTIVVSRSSTPTEEVIVKHSIEDAIAYAREVDQEEIFIFGGGEIYKAALPYTDGLYLTIIDAEDAGADAHFPPYENVFTKETAREEHEYGGLRYAWVTLER